MFMSSMWMILNPYWPSILAITHGEKKSYVPGDHVGGNLELKVANENGGIEKTINDSVDGIHLVNRLHD